MVAGRHQHRASAHLTQEERPMAMIDGVSKLGIARNVKTDTAATDAAFV